MCVRKGVRCCAKTVVHRNVGPTLSLIGMRYLVCQGTSISRTFHGFVLTGDPSSASGANWKPNETIQVTVYELAGVLFAPGRTPV